MTIAAPSSHDPYGIRQITIGLSATGNQRFEYSWSISSTTAPNTAYLQTSTDMTNRKGTLNFLGKYSGSGTTWNGGTQPDQDWYLWVRSVKTNGMANAWGTPLKVHTPKAGVWPGVGDSTSSGHHQIADDPSCAIPLGCTPATLVPNDPDFSWVKGAVANANTALKLPTAWKIDYQVIAISGTKTADFGKAGAVPGTTAWTTDGQAGELSVLLVSHYGSWNYVSMTGGANDTNWVDKLSDWYVTHSTDYGPWNVPTTDTPDCPDTESVWQDLNSNNLSAAITTNLQALVTVANNATTGVRVIDVNYPYSVDPGTPTTDNPCYSDWNDGATEHGDKSTIDALDATHTAVTGTNVKHLDLRTVFGTTPVANGSLQLTRLYGYPHYSVSGQSLEAAAASNLATGTGW